MALYDHIARCNAHDMGGFRPFRVADVQVGWVRHQLAHHLERWPHLFDLSADVVSLREDIGEPDDRTAAMIEVCDVLANEGKLPANRAEQFDVYAEIGGDSLMLSLIHI